MLSRFFSVLCLICLLASAAYARPGLKDKENPGTFYDRSKEGWFWYQDPVPEDDQEGEELPPPPPVFRDFSEQQVWNMSPPQFQEVFNNTLNLAIQEPSVENVADWTKMKDIGRRKALEFTNVAQYVVQTQPQLNYMKDSPLATPGRKALYTQQKVNVEETIYRAKEKNGLLYFYSPNCSYCLEQTKILQMFIQKYDWDVKPINIDEQPGLASRFGVETIPSVILVDTANPNPFPVGVGVVAVTELEENIFRGMRILEGLTDPSQYSMYDFQRGTALDPRATRPQTPAGSVLGR